MPMHYRYLVKAGLYQLLFQLTKNSVVHLLNLEPQIAFLFQLVLLSS